MSEKSFEDLYQKVDRLIRHCEQLQADNRSLHAQKASLEEQCSSLREKNDLARGRVESMISHLRDLKESTS